MLGSYGVAMSTRFNGFGDTLTVKVDDQIGRSMTPEADVVELGDNVILFPFGGRRASLQA